MELLCLSDGRVRAIYDEEIDLSVLGSMEISRASHVEPSSNGFWQVDLAPVQGPQLGPFANRSGALKAEVTWLRNNWLGLQVE